MADRLGAQVGNYRLMQMLGQGGFAQVYLGEHLHLGTLAAVKLLHAPLASAEEAARFRQEARTIAALIHPHIVRVLDFGVSDGMPYLVLDFAPGSSLRRRHPSGTPLPLATIAPYVQQAALGLQYAHDQKIIHRDIKPQNLLVGRKGELVLSDFGISVVAESTSRQQAQGFSGTVAYSAPEQMQEHPRPASDQYSLGVVVYEWLTGQLPFSGAFQEVIAKHLFVAPPPLRHHVASLSPEIEQVVLRALAKDPKERFASVAAFAYAFEQASQSDVAPTFAARLPPPGFAGPAARVIGPAAAPPAGPPGDAPAPSAELAAGTPAVTPPAAETYSALTLPGSAGPLVPVPPKPKNGISRRAVLLGLTGLAVTGAGVTALVLVEKSGGKQQTGNHPSASPPSRPTTLRTAVYRYRGHRGVVHDVAWSPNGQRIASASDDGTVQVWDALTGKNSITYSQHTGPVYAVAWSFDGSLLASVGADGTLQVWMAVSGNRLGYKTSRGPIHGISWFAGGIARAGDDGLVVVWFPFESVEFVATSYNLAHAVAWSPNGRFVVSGGTFIDTGDYAVVSHTTASGSTTSSRFSGHRDAIESLAWSPDGSKVVSGSWDKTVQIWTPTSGGQNRQANVIYRGHHHRVESVAWMPNGTHIASASIDGTVQVWDAGSGTTLLTYTGHAGAVWTVAWSPSGHYLASGGSDQTVQVWQPG
jgi:eukaryotic-like serine/threonine-protein kinase